MNAAMVKVIWDLIQEWGPEALSAIQDIMGSFESAEYVTFCGDCGEESEVFIVTVNGKRYFRGKCPTHGFRRKA